MFQDVSSRNRLDELSKRKRERWAIVVLSILFVGALVLEFQLIKLSSSLPFVNSIFFFGLINFNIILLLFIVFLVYRNATKLFLERRRKFFGSQLKTKLVLSFLSFSLVPTILLFLIGAIYINSSFDKWFSIKISNTLQNSLEITEAFYKDSRTLALHHADILKRDLQVFKNNEYDDEAIDNLIKEKSLFYGLDGVELYIDPFSVRKSFVSEKLNNGSLPRVSLELFQRVIAEKKAETVIHNVEGGDIVRSLVPIPNTGFPWSRSAITDSAIISVSKFIPRSLTNKVEAIAGSIDDYRGVNPLKYPIKTIYLMILAMITLLIAFSAIWVGLYLAKELTGPIASLAEGTQAVASGNLDYKIESAGADEISSLVTSFNKMTRDLKFNRKKLEETHSDLVSTNLSLKRGKLYIETILKNVAAGVLSLDSELKVATMNKSAEELLGCSSDWAIGKPAEEVFPKEFEELVPKVLKSVGKTRQGFLRIKVKGSEETRSVIVKVTPIGEEEMSQESLGAVFVFEDITNLIKAQREAAWREVARRIAHEIKNPLTPIKLSAQRLQKRFLGHLPENKEIFEECTTTIIKQVDELKTMVNEFSSFARFPAANPEPTNLNEIVREVYSLYNEAHKSVEFIFNPSEDIPIVEIDSEQMKRAFINLVENAIAAFGDDLNKPILREGESKPTVTIETRFKQSLQLVQVSVLDNGPGIPEGIRERIFEPYYSTKKQGTGLGLSIVNRIVTDHSGFVRVFSPKSGGSEFLIELPLDAGLVKPSSVDKRKINQLVT
jgi:two-component system nitrogen regulation sensor histidine kinase NtrY